MRARSPAQESGHQLIPPAKFQLFQSALGDASDAIIVHQPRAPRACPEFRPSRRLSRLARRRELAPDRHGPRSFPFYPSSALGRSSSRLLLSSAARSFSSPLPLLRPPLLARAAAADATTVLRTRRQVVLPFTFHFKILTRRYPPPWTSSLSQIMFFTNSRRRGTCVVSSPSPSSKEEAPRSARD